MKSARELPEEIETAIETRGDEETVFSCILNISIAKATDKVTYKRYIGRKTISLIL